MELITRKTEERNANRVHITLAVWKRFLKDCRQIALDQGYHRSMILIADLYRYRDAIQSACETKPDIYHRTMHAIGFADETQRLLNVLNRAIDVVTQYRMEWFYYQDFNYYYTVTESKYPWFRSKQHKACLIVLFYYFITPILFCHIIPENNICPGGNLYSLRIPTWLTRLSR